MADEPVPSSSARQTVDVAGHRVTLTHLDKVVFASTGTTKAELLSYYADLAPHLVAHTAGRPASFVRAPDGPDGQRWFAKHPPPGTPDWVPLVQVAGRSGPSDYIEVDSPAVLLQMANLGGWEVHVPQWTVPAKPDDPPLHDRLVLDLDPGPGCDLTTCAVVALRARQLLADDGLASLPVVSGSKGLHLYAPLAPTGGEHTTAYAKALAQRLQDEHPRLVTAVMARAERPNKVFIDWSQNTTAKTTAAPYTLRVRERPGIATPVTWDELEAAGSPADLAFTMDEVRERVADRGDLLKPLLATKGKRPRLPEDD
ncbi:non-homologous end-joining DNA ligase [Streptomyces sp. NPDC060194]|uniref:non-homologous end-joining DNA ligase n=1 Tax=Streptomyces sp. NPDC060194 TaxID=3347069 RepID=UPI003656BE94